MDNVVLTPHIAGYSDEFAANFWEHSVRTLTAMADGQGPLWTVNPSARPLQPATSMLASAPSPRLGRHAPAQPMVVRDVDKGHGVGKFSTG